jgi:hypothetical protein
LDEGQIKTAIETRVQSAKTVSYRIWTIGITDNLQRRKKEHDDAGENTKYWVAWEADSEDVARNVEAYFLDKAKGMKGGVGGGTTGKFVYIF